MISAGFQFRLLTIHDYDSLVEALLWQEGVGMSRSDSVHGVAKFLARNLGMSFVADAEGMLADCVLGGHDGRRGYLYHVSVSPQFRRRGVARGLVARTVAAITAEGIKKIHIDVFADNGAGLEFWRAIGWHDRDELKRFSFTPPVGRNS
ncbi:GNAT family N-acetyltransferase [Methylocystis sp. Sn-Cys]|uniref:GNAT family N-acetyltransferase n=1 Tax=Methylocystis sp. Sn-Cys TaxID=1701263 RepID=UPI0019241784|nr:GNAT family N-acetyltransferase [Methylocystis sp. Sn-Cys]MBL1257870.1 GNAT family N-acetyltransferase [Methylocystis sp. Sn-Cys]